MTTREPQVQRREAEYSRIVEDLAYRYDGVFSLGTCPPAAFT